METEEQKTNGIYATDFDSFFPEQGRSIVHEVHENADMQYKDGKHDCRHYSLNLLSRLLTCLDDLSDKYSMYYASIEVANNNSQDRISSHGIVLISNKETEQSIIIEPQSGKNGSEIVSYTCNSIKFDDHRKLVRYYIYNHLLDVEPPTLNIQILINKHSSKNSILKEIERIKNKL